MTGDSYLKITHPLSEILAHGDAKQVRTKYQLPVPGKRSYHCKHDHCRHCAMLSCTCPCHVVDDRRGGLNALK